jgi:hypothetical protein
MPTTLTWEISEGPQGEMQRRAAGTNSWVATKVSPSLAVPVNLTRPTLETLIRFFADNRFEQHRQSLSPKVQLEVGFVIANALLAGERLPRGGGWIRLVPPEGADRFGRPDFDDFVRGIPWPLLADKSASGRSEFLARRTVGEQWIATLSMGRMTRTVPFPWCPRILAAIPEPATGGDKTDGERHWQKIESDMLTGAYPKQPGGLLDLVKTAKTWQAFHSALTKDEPPDVVYFYGHARRRGKETQLAFERQDNPNIAEWIATTTLGEACKLAAEQGRRPAVFFANCCQGDSEIASGIGTQVGPYANSVITSRTFSIVTDAQIIGQALLWRIVLEGMPPHLALLDFYGKDLSALGTGDQGGRWAVPVVYTNYSTWTALEPKRRLGVNAARIELFGPSIPLRVGRANAIRTVESGVKHLLETNRSALAAVFWRASPRQGLMHFANRIRDHLREKFPIDVFSNVAVELQANPRPAEATELQKALVTAIHLGLTEDQRSHANGPGLSFLPYRPLECISALQRRFPLVPSFRSVLLVTHNEVEMAENGFLADYLRIWCALFKAAYPNRLARVVLNFPVNPRSNTIWTFPSPQEIAADSEPPPTFIDLTPEFHSLVRSEIAEHIREFNGVYGSFLPTAAQEIPDSVLEGSNGGVFLDVVDQLKARIALGT